MPESAVEAYRIGVSFVANAQKVIGPVDEMIRAMDRIKTAQGEVNSGFTSMVQSLSGARRVATSLADEMERAARAARSIKPAPGAARGARYADAAPSGPARPPSRTAASVAVATGANASTSSNYMSPFPAAAEGLPGRPQLLLPPPVSRPPSTALTVIPGQGNSYSAGANFRRSDYKPNFQTVPDREWSVPFGPEPESRSARKVRVAQERADAQRERDEARAQGRKDRADEKARIAREKAEAKARDARDAALRTPFGLPHLPSHHHAMTIPEIFAGYAVAHVISSGFQQAGDVDNVYAGMVGLPGAAAKMPAIKAMATSAMAQNDLLTPYYAALLGRETFALSAGSMAEAPAFMASLNKADRAMMLSGKSDQDAFNQSQSLIRALDYMNGFTNRKTGEIDPIAAAKNTDIALKMIIASGGMVKGQNVFSFATSAGSAGQNMSPEGFMRAEHFIDIKPQKAGTQIRSFEDLFGGDHTRMAKKDAAYFKTLGLIGKDNRFVDQDAIMHDPVGWIINHLVPLADKHPELKGHIQRMTIGDLYSESVGSVGNIERQQRMTAGTNVSETLNAWAGGSKAAELRLETSFTRFETALGQFAQGPGIKILDKLSDTFNHMTSYMAAHPDDMDKFAKDAGSAIEGLITIAVGFGKFINSIPKPLLPILLGAYAGGRTAGVWGAVGGAGIGAGYEAVKWVNDHGGPGMMQPGNGVMYPDAPNGGAPGSDGQPIIVEMHMDGKKIATAAVPHLRAIAASDTRKHRRSTSAAADWHEHLQMPNAQGGVN